MYTLERGRIIKFKGFLYMSLFLRRVLPLSILLLSFGCGGQKTAEEGWFGAIKTMKQLSAVVDLSDNSLVAFDLYADWCGPCRRLAPTLDSIAKENKNRVTFYRINVDQLPQAAQAFQVSAIPVVVFVKNKSAVCTVVGMQPKEEYVKVIDEYFKNTPAAAGDTT
jgi:thioredoxin